MKVIKNLMNAFQVEKIMNLSNDKLIAAIYIIIIILIIQYL